MQTPISPLESALLLEGAGDSEDRSVPSLLSASRSTDSEGRNETFLLNCSEARGLGEANWPPSRLHDHFHAQGSMEDSNTEGAPL